MKRKKNIYIYCLLWKKNADAASVIVNIYDKKDRKLKENN